MSSSPNRIRLILLCVVLFQVAIIGRLFYLQVIKHDFYAKRVANQLNRSITVPANRGRILDRMGRTLATDIDSYSLYVHPQKAKHVPVEQLASILGISTEKLQGHLRSKSPFVWVKRHINSIAKEKLDRLKLTDAFGFVPENRRLYMLSEQASHVLGFVGTDMQGLGGFEYGQNNLLSGKDGQLLMETDPFGRQIASGLRVAKKPTHGKNIYLTIDLNIQQTLDDALEKGQKRTGARRAMGIVMNARTGEILGMAAYPNFNPNEYWNYDELTRKNSMVSDVYEPGSTFKVIAISAGINEGIITSHDMFFCPNHFQIGNRVIGEAHEHPEQNYTVNEILEESINIGTAKIAMQVGPKIFEKYITKYGFGKKTGIELPGESAGIVRPAKGWSAPDNGIIGFGQGIAVTPLQLIAAYSAYGNKGYMVKPYIIKQVEDWDGTILKQGQPTATPVLSEHTAEVMKDMLVNVVEHGTGVAAQIPGFWVGGKTGTAQKARPTGGYMPGQYVISFIGLLPASNPEVIILCILDDPIRDKWGSSGTGPVFNDVARACIKYLKINPDRDTDPVLYTVKNEKKPFPALLKSARMRAPDL